MNYHISLVALLCSFGCSLSANESPSPPSLDRSRVHDPGYLMKLYASRVNQLKPGGFEDIYRALPAMIRHYNYVQGKRDALGKKIAQLDHLYKQRVAGLTSAGEEVVPNDELENLISKAKRRLAEMSGDVNVVREGVETLLGEVNRQVHEDIDRNENSIQEKRQEGGDWKRADKRQEGGDWKRAEKRQEGGDWKRGEKRQEGGDWKRGEKRQEGGAWKRQEGGDWKRAEKRQEGGDWKRAEKRQEGGDWKRAEKRQEGGDWKRAEKRQEGGDWKRAEKRQEGGAWKRQEGGAWKRQEGGDWKRNMD